MRTTEELLQERVPHLLDLYQGALESIRGCAQNAQAINANPDLTPDAKARKIKDQLRVGLDGAREGFSRERAKAARERAAIVKARNDLRNPEALNGPNALILRELKGMRLDAHLRTLEPEKLSALLRKTAREGRREVLDAVTDSFDWFNLDWDHQIGPAWETWTETVNNGELSTRIEEAEAVESAIDSVSRRIMTEARSVVVDTTKDQYRPQANKPVLDAFESALAEMKSEAETAAAREAYRARTGRYPDRPGTTDDAGAEQGIPATDDEIARFGAATT